MNRVSSSPPPFEPDWASPPGDTIADLSEERGGSRSELARRCGLGEAELEALIAGRAPLTEAVAEGLAAAVGSTREFWLRREVRFREACARRAKAGRRG